MKKLTLQFSALPELTRFSKRLRDGYIINTINLTVTAMLSEVQVNMAIDFYKAELVEAVDNTEKEYAEDLFF